LAFLSIKVCCSLDVEFLIHNLIVGK
jgi:hypothetical protein